MKHMIGTAGIVGVLTVAVVSWRMAERFLTQKDDMSVMVGLGIVGVLVGLLASGVAFVVQKVFRQADAVASIGQRNKEERSAVN